jgi:ABC-type bacteriocin/lantibiotic exporter with double-glycine peptidase domain
MVLGTFGIAPSLSRSLELKLAEGNAPCSVWELQDALMHYKIATTGYRLRAREVGSLLLPSIIYLKPSHFAVLVEVDSSYLILQDPRRGRIKLSHRSFSFLFGGVALSPSIVS